MWRQQETSFTCGPAAFRNCLIFKGIRASEKLLRKLANTSFKGTSEKGLFKICKYFDIDYKEHISKSERVFGNKLIKALKQGNPCIVLTDSSTHWIAVIKYQNRKIHFIDPESNSSIKSLTLKDFKKYGYNYDKYNNIYLYYFIELFFNI